MENEKGIYTEEENRINNILTIMRKHDVLAFEIGELKVTLNPKPLEFTKPDKPNADDFGHYNSKFHFGEAEKAGM